MTSITMKKKIIPIKNLKIKMKKKKWRRKRESPTMKKRKKTTRFQSAKSSQQ